MTYDLLIWPDPILNKRCRFVPPSDPELLNTVIPVMLRVVKERDGLGLAANQVGYLGRVIVVRTNTKDGREPVVMINPVIKSRAGAKRGTEGCLSLPGLRVPVTRADEIGVSYTDVAGAQIEATLEGLDAVVVQHEIDHLDGKTLADQPRVGQWKSVDAKVSNADVLKDLRTAFDKHKREAQ